MRTLIKICSIASCLCLLASCTQEEAILDSNDSLRPLEIATVSTEANNTRAVIEGEAFLTSQEAKLGLFVTASSGSNYDDKTSGYKNIAYTKAANSTQWSCTSPILLSSTQGKLYGYYPYSSSASNLKQIPVTSSLNGTDYLYLTEPSDYVNDHTPMPLSISMKHALARLDVKFKKESSVPTATLTNVTLTGNAIAKTGTMDLSANGAITATAAAEGLSYTVSASLASTVLDATTCKFLIVPATTTANDIVLTCEISGKKYTKTLSSVSLLPGTCKEITVTLNGTKLEVSNVGITSWNKIASDEGYLEPVVKIAKMVTGKEFVKTIKNLARGDEADYDYFDQQYIEHISFDYGSESTSGVTISETSSEFSIYANYNQTTKSITISTPADKISMTDMSYMFYSLFGLQSIDLSGFITEDVTNMDAMFYHTGRLETISGISEFDTHNVTSMENVFAMCRVTSLDLTKWDVSNVTSMVGMFYCAYRLSSLDLSGWDTGKVTDMFCMFYGCTYLTYLYLGENFVFCGDALDMFYKMGILEDDWGEEEELDCIIKCSSENAEWIRGHTSISGNITFESL